MSCRRIAEPNDPEKAPPSLCPGLQPVGTAHENPWFKVLDRGGYFTLEYERPQVVVLPVVEGSSLLMVRVKRPVIADCPLELPAGDSMPGETPREAARRELAEETGVRLEDLNRFVPLRPLSEMPGRIPVLLSVFRADLSRAELEARAPHDDEIEELVELDYVQAAEKIVSGEIYLSSPMAIVARLLLEAWTPKAGTKKEAR